MVELVYNSMFAIFRLSENIHQFTKGALFKRGKILLKYTLYFSI